MLSEKKFTSRMIYILLFLFSLNVFNQSSLILAAVFILVVIFDRGKLYIPANDNVFVVLVFFAAVFIPATYYNKGEKMEVSMMMSGFVSFGAVYLASKLLMLFGIQLMDYADLFLQILFGASLLLFAISWAASNIIIQKRAS